MYEYSESIGIWMNILDDSKKYEWDFQVSNVYNNIRNFKINY